MVFLAYRAMSQGVVDLNGRQNVRPRLAVVSGSGNLDPSIPMFDIDQKEGSVPLIYTTKAGAENLCLTILKAEQK